MNKCYEGGSCSHNNKHGDSSTNNDYEMFSNLKEQTQTRVPYLRTGSKLEIRVACTAPEQ